MCGNYLDVSNFVSELSELGRTVRTFVRLHAKVDTLGVLHLKVNKKLLFYFFFNVSIL
jgi:hypothetical protein